MATGPNMARDESLAGQSVKQGNYTITYNDRGYATKAVKDNGKSATSTVKTQNANASTAHKNAYDAAQRGDWDAVGNYVNEIAYAGGTNAYGNYDMTEANKYMQELQDEFKYDSNDYYQKRYDAVYGKGAWDGNTGTGKPVYNEYSQALVNAYNKNAANGVKQPTAATTTAQPNVALGDVYTMAQGVGGNMNTATANADLTQYLKNMYAQDLQAQLSQLSSGYKEDVAAVKAQDDLIKNQYKTAMNDVSSQNDLQKMYMNEIGLANGLNTGATGQMALAQNMAYQNNLGNLYQQQMADINANNQLLSQLSNQYNSAVAQATAKSNSALNNALYQALAKQQETAREEALTLLSNGVPVTDSMLSAANMTPEEAALWLQLAGVKSGTTKATTDTPAANPTGYNNGDLTNDQVWLMQNLLGVTADGLWGAQSSAAAGNKTAAEAWDDLSARINGNYVSVQDALSKVESSGRNVNSRAADVIEAAYKSGKITENQAKNLLAQYGL